jgi:transposase-like protein
MTCKGSEPARIFVDGLDGYPQAMTHWEGASKKPELVARVGIKKPGATNNRIERMNGTLLERVKVQRGWKAKESAIAEGQRIHYIFVKPHMTLENQTPADSAGIGIDGKDKWLEMLLASLKPKNEGLLK